MRNELIEKIRSVPLTKTQKKIAEFFVYNPQRAATMSCMDVANELGTSDVSVIRFTRTIGYDGYSEFKEHLLTNLIEDAGNSASLTERMRKSTSEYSDASVQNGFLDLMQQNLSLSFNSNREEDYALVVEKLIKAKKRYVIGLRGCKGTSVKFGRTLGFMLDHVYAISDSDCTSYASLMDINRGDFLIMFVFTRYYKTDIKYLEEARRHGAYICVVTDDPLGMVCPYADTVLNVTTSHMSFFHSGVATEMISEYLLTLVSRKVDFAERLRLKDEFSAEQRETEWPES